MRLIFLPAEERKDKQTTSCYFHLNTDTIAIQPTEVARLEIGKANELCCFLVVKLLNRDQNGQRSSLPA
jgi:hypothetical protein